MEIAEHVKVYETI